MARFDHTELMRGIAAAARSITLNEHVPGLVSAALWRNETELTADGALSAVTGVHTGRSPKDKFIVRDATTEHTVWWDNTAPMASASFDALLADATAHLAGKPLFVEELVAAPASSKRFGVRVITENAWHALFIRNLLTPAEGEGFAAEVTIVHAPSFKADPVRHGVRTETVIALDVTRNIVVIGGTAYAGEIKKSVFSLFNFHAPDQDVMPMHCSANVGRDGSTALFFGLSGTGKTTLSTDPERDLIGDDEHGWDAYGIFNLEGGCYAKTANLSAEAEPEIYAAARRFGTVLENVVLDDQRVPLFNDLSRTENTRAAYSLSVLPRITPTGGQPDNVVLLTADAFGVLPPIARLTHEQAVYQFLSGYTAKLAGTERGVTEPKATFSTCFGAPFMSRHPSVYAGMLKDRLATSGAKVWLINTGWFGGAYGTGKRIAIRNTRLLLDAALSGALDAAQMRTDPNFGFEVPVAVAGVDPGVLAYGGGWADLAAYEAAAGRLVRLFADNFATLGPDAAALIEAPRTMAAE